MFKLFKSIREYKKESLLTPLCVAIEVVLEVLITYYSAIIVDNGVNVGNYSVIYKTGFILCIMAILALIAGVMGGNFCAKATAGFSKNLRHDIFYKIQNFSFKNIDKFKSSGLVTRLTTDVENVANAYQMIIRTAIRAPMVIIFASIMICKINFKVALVFFLIMPLLLIGLLFIGSRAHPSFKETFEEYDNLNNVVSENLNGMRVVKSFVSEDKEIKKFNKVSTKIYKLFRKAQNIVALNNPLMNISIYSAMLLVGYVGAKMITVGSLTTGQLMSLFSYIMQLMNSLLMLSFLFIMIVISREACIRINQVFDEDSNIKNNTNPVYEVKDGSIKFNNVSFSYVDDNKKLCLEDINLDIKSGMTVGIIGGTGSSKSTLINLIPRLYDVTKGSIMIGGVDVRDYDLFTLRDNVSVVLQKNVLFSGTINSNLKWGNDKATKEEIKEVCDLSCCNEFIDHFENNYDYKIEQGGTNVSGGQKQRLCIARALLKKPKILILDDSTSAVDTKTDKLIRDALKKYIPDTTKIIIAQRISSVKDCDMIIVMDNGKINGIGKHDYLMKNNKIYNEVYSSQGGVLSE